MGERRWRTPTVNMVDDLIFDLGMNTGDDTDFYLKKGFRVVAVEANPQLCAQALDRFRPQLAEGRLHIVNKAVAAQAGEIELFLNEDVSGWSTTERRWLQTRTAGQTRSRAITVHGVTIRELLDEYGAPYYIKADIQGAESVLLQALLDCGQSPPYVSVSAGSDVLPSGALGHVRQQVDLLSRLGYRKFMIVAQQDTEFQVCPHPAREGRYVAHEFPHGSSGLFGRELPGKWLTASQALREHGKIVISYMLAGHSRSPATWFARLPSDTLKNGLDRLFWRGLGWYDTHATR